MSTTGIIGTGSALPQAIVTNHDLAQIMDTSDEWIRTRTGICERRLASKEETVAALAARAGRKALEEAGMSPEEVELVLVATCSSENYFPSVGCCVSHELGLVNAAAMDLSAACSGFVFALHTAHAYIMSGIYENALVIGAETFSQIMDWKDRSTCVLFGDGAGACVVKRQENGILAFSQHSDGSQGHVLTASAPRMATPVSEYQEAEPVVMDGQGVFRFAVKTMPDCIEKLLTKSGTEADEVKYFILHQANSRILQSVAKRLHVSQEKFPMNLDKCGNTSAASIPILLDELNKKGMLEKGDKLVLAGFGAGLTWGATLLTF